ncbi:BON domain-containing protein [Noviherbaspirillum malthae]|jgi:osmotically-inducible protein OsmY|uniref:BON domain-containing protein n=1 Tax=Noviherbaspirillum malthae TaxID=1260987 RepID=UPI00188DF198|nr:BON domain-containing protein [Noviherbaspirillum malthae]
MRHYQSITDVKRDLPFQKAKVMLMGHFVAPRERQVNLTTATDADNEDEEIRKNVVAELQSEPTIDATSIDVCIDRGVLTLRGITDGIGDQWLIESAVRRIPGVTDVVLELVAVQSDPGTRTDEDIRRECEHVLGSTVPGANHAIRVVVSSGWVTLSGNVAWEYERQVTEEIVSHLMGVNGVNGQIKVRLSDE